MEFRSSSRNRGRNGLPGPRRTACSAVPRTTARSMPGNTGFARSPSCSTPPAACVLALASSFTCSAAIALSSLVFAASPPAACLSCRMALRALGLDTERDKVEQAAASGDGQDLTRPRHDRPRRPGSVQARSGSDTANWSITVSEVQGSSSVQDVDPKRPLRRRVQSRESAPGLGGDARRRRIQRRVPAAIGRQPARDGAPRRPSVEPSRHPRLDVRRHPRACRGAAAPHCAPGASRPPPGRRRRPPRRSAPHGRSAQLCDYCWKAGDRGLAALMRRRTVRRSPSIRFTRRRRWIRSRRRTPQDAPAGAGNGGAGTAAAGARGCSRPGAQRASDSGVPDCRGPSVNGN